MKMQNTRSARGLPFLTPERAPWLPNKEAEPVFNTLLYGAVLLPNDWRGAEITGTKTEVLATHISIDFISTWGDVMSPAKRVHMNLDKDTPYEECKAIAARYKDILNVRRLG